VTTSANTWKAKFTKHDRASSASGRKTGYSEIWGMEGRGMAIRRVVTVREADYSAKWISSGLADKNEAAGAADAGRCRNRCVGLQRA
jgi:hypothetical protein